MLIQLKWNRRGQQETLQTSCKVDRHSCFQDGSAAKEGGPNVQDRSTDKQASDTAEQDTYDRYNVPGKTSTPWSCSLHGRAPYPRSQFKPWTLLERLAAPNCVYFK